ncbi:hypothetical protein Bphy_5366 [Paraburkholderia phymatum STM815]|uniref:Uncharacterized protein n=1 Tax=Paraburkholderia phymatum (strain DSM 17167 / CIP 108236 / LMG 21445 / STM815) TaxID=391038 RepID=B2JNE2_PARP8|nr:hypothetical protein Bphy_5366 [Paraburkholderia phymatum STM815]
MRTGFSIVEKRLADRLAARKGVEARARRAQFTKHSIRRHIRKAPCLMAFIRETALFAGFVGRIGGCGYTLICVRRSSPFTEMKARSSELL